MKAGAATDAPIELVPYDPGWPARFERERQLLEGLLAPWLVASIEHVGSTAIPGMLAKPIIDIMAPVRSLEESRPAIAAVASADYHYHPYKGDVMHWFCKPSPAVRTHHLHLVPFESPLWFERLRFRDAMRRDASLRAEYAALKHELAGRFRGDREAYTQAKADFVMRVANGVRHPENALRWMDALLVERGIPYLVCGGLAAIGYGSTRPLNDIDLFVPGEHFGALVAAGAARVSKPARRYTGEGWDLEYVQFIVHGTKIEVGNAEGARIQDAATGEWVGLAVAFDEPHWAQVLGVRVPLMDVDSMIAYKSTLARAVDREDVAAMRRWPESSGH